MELTKVELHSTPSYIIFCDVNVTKNKTMDVLHDVNVTKNKISILDPIYQPRLIQYLLDAWRCLRLGQNTLYSLHLLHSSSSFPICSLTNHDCMERSYNYSLNSQLLEPPQTFP